MAPRFGGPPCRIPAPWCRKSALRAPDARRDNQTVIRKPTVLILGAGASAPYGYPLGGALVERILTLTDPGGAGGPLHRVLIGAFVAPLADFNRRLRGSETSSIDDFLESNPDYAELGKLCIAGALTVHGPPFGYPVLPNLHWYKYLWERLRQGAAVSRQFGENRLRVVTTTTNDRLSGTSRVS